MILQHDQEVERFRTRALVGPYPYMWLDATFVKVRQHGRVVSMAVVVATGVTSRGEREVLGLEVGPSEDGAFWQQFLRGLVARGLTGVQLVISDAHEGLVQAIADGAAGGDVAKTSKSLAPLRVGARAEDGRRDGRGPAGGRSCWGDRQEPGRPTHGRPTGHVAIGPTPDVAFVARPLG